MNDPAWWPLLAAAGSLAGSLLATIVSRWPQRRSIASGRSRCDGCDRPIPPWQLIPIGSFLAQRGRAACCGGAIDRAHPAIEAGCALIGAAAFAISPDAAGVAAALTGWLLLTLAVLDLRHFWLPDALVLPLALIGVVAGTMGIGVPLADRLIGGVVGWTALAGIALAYARVRGREGLGQGDAKLLGAIGLWLGWRALPWVVLGACLIGIGWVLAMRMRGREMRADQALPLGALLAVAAWGAWVVGVIVG